MKREGWGWKDESWVWMLFSIVLVTLAVPLGIWLFDHPLILLLPLSATRSRSKDLEDDPSDRRPAGGSDFAVRGPDGEWTATGGYWIT